MKHVLAIDAGTTGITSLVVAANGRIVARGYREFTQHYPQPGWVEHDADEIFTRACESAREAIARAGVGIEAIGITNQRETVVVWERATGRPVHRAIVWQDRRTAARCEALAPQLPAITARTGLVLDPYFSATKLEWMIRELRLLDRYAPGELAAGTIDSWLVWRLTNGAMHATEPTNASRTMLFDIDARRWSEELCALFGVPVEMLPEVRHSSGDFGAAAAQHLGIAAPITGIAGDQQAALFGQGCWRPGLAKNTYGTGAFLLTYCGDARPSATGGMLATLACDERGRPAYALEAAIFVAGAAIQWLRDELGILPDAASSASLAASLGSNDGVYFVPALAGLGAPHWEPAARGTIFGLTRGSGRAHLARAALEAMAYSTADVLAPMVAASGHALTRLRVDGGASANDWLMAFQSDVLGVPVERPDSVETTALGAAGLAGLAAGVWSRADDFLAQREFTTFMPTRSEAEVAGAMAGWRRAMDATLAWSRHP